MNNSSSPLLSSLTSSLNQIPLELDSNEISSLSPSPALPEEGIEKENRRYYEVYFTCFVGTYFTTKFYLNEGDFVIVQADRGHDIGVVSRLVEFEVTLTNENNEIISVVPKDEYPVRAMLQDKVIAQNQALDICRNKCVELLISTHIEVVATEFQFDRKKLTLFYKKHSDVSVCKLIRKLYNIFKMRIWMEPVDVELWNESFSNITAKFLSLAQITIPVQEKTAEFLAVPSQIKNDCEPVPEKIPIIPPSGNNDVSRRDPVKEKLATFVPSNPQSYQNALPSNYQRAPYQQQAPAPSQYYRSTPTTVDQVQYPVYSKSYQERAAPRTNPAQPLRSSYPARQAPIGINYARDQSYNGYHQQQYPSQSAYYENSRQHAGTYGRQDRGDRYDMVDDRYSQSQYYHTPSLPNRYQENPSTRSLNLPQHSYPNDDGRFSIDLFDDDTLTLSSGESSVDYYNLMPQSSSSAYYPFQG